MEFLSNEWVIMFAGWVFMVMSELIAKSKLKSNGVVELIFNVLKYLKGK